jgi:phage/plasmid-associated DNA primase
MKLSDMVSRGSRDTTIVAQAGRYAYDVEHGNMSLLQAIQQGVRWVQDQTERVFGDDIDPQKIVEKIVEFIKKDVYGPRRVTLPKSWDDGLDDELKKGLGVDEFGDEHRRFTGEEIIAYFRGAIEDGNIDPKSPQMTSLAEGVCARIAGNVAAISPLEQDQIIRFVSQTTGGAISVAAIRKRIAELSKGEIIGNDHTELAKAVIEEVSRTGEIRYYAGVLWQWKGDHWETTESDSIQKLIADHYGSYPAAKKAGDHAGIMKILKSQISGPLRKADLRGINFVNGYLTEDYELREHDKDYGCTYVLPYPYRPELAGKAVKFQQMLATYWGHDEDYAEKVEALQQAMAVTMFGVAPRYDRAICCYGKSRSGKSRLLNLIKGLMPKGCSVTIPPSEWGKDYSRAQLAEKVLNVAGELPESTFIEGNLFKQIVSGEETQARLPYEPPFSFYPIAAHWFGTNHAPKTKDSSEGFTNRWLILKFNRAVPIGERIPDFEKIILEEEREAVAAWAVQGYEQMKSQGAQYTLPKSHKEEIEMIADRSNSVLFFLKCLRQGGRILLGSDESSSSTSIDHLYSVYRSWCVSEASVSRVNSQDFLAMIDELQTGFGFQVRREPRVSGVPQVVCQYLTLVEKKAA